MALSVTYYAELGADEEDWWQVRADDPDKRRRIRLYTPAAQPALKKAKTVRISMMNGGLFLVFLTGEEKGEKGERSKGDQAKEEGFVVVVCELGGCGCSRFAWQGSS